jgi:hypothetical protein
MSIGWFFRFEEMAWLNEGPGLRTKAMVLAIDLD